MKKATLLCLLAAVGLAGCNEEKKDEIKDVAYWKSHIPELSAKLDECENNPAKAMNDGNCINARNTKIRLSKAEFNKGETDPLRVYREKKEAEQNTNK